MGQTSRERARAEAARWMSGQNGQIHLVPRSSSGEDQEPVSNGNSAVRGVAIFLAGVACGVGAMMVSPSSLPWSSAPQDTSPPATSTPAITVPASIELTAYPAQGESAAGGNTGQPGDALVAATYVVQPGDSLIRIADQFGVPLEVLAEANGITDHGHIIVGQELLVPGGQD